jgi:hypothetical protein
VIESGRAVEEALVALERYGLLLFSDPALPSLVGIIVGEPLRSSWWGHPRGNVIYHAMNALDQEARVLSTKLVASKVTYVHQRLWAAVFAIGCAREAWQLDQLSPAERWLLAQVDADDELQTDLVVPPPQVLRSGKTVPDAARELERRLLVHATQVHTPSGAHAKVLQSWPRWASEAHVGGPLLSPDEARLALEAAAERLTEGVLRGTAALPWRASSRARDRQTE